jgi:hypothetical protein
MPERESARDQGEQQAHRGRPGEPFCTGPVAGQSRARPRSSPCPLVLAALLVGAVGARVALAPSRSDAVGALAAAVETWIILGRGGRHGAISLGTRELTRAVALTSCRVLPGVAVSARC